MRQSRKALVGAEVFDGETRHTDCAVLLSGDRVEALVPRARLDPGIERIVCDGGLLCPGFVDLQVNGGGGILFNDTQSVDGLRRMAAAHARFGATAILPTLITDRPERTEAAIEAVAAAVAEDVPGVAGLHLEGPHLSVTRKGAHDAALIRPMDASDIARLSEAAARVPFLKMTVAPETVTPDQIATLTKAGVLISLGHSDATYDTIKAAADAGAACVTHLFNAMSQLGNREPGLVGAALSLGGLSAGLIADGIHVHPASLGAALRAKQGPGRIFLVSDAMSVAGTDAVAFELNGRQVTRRDGRLLLSDGTLAGADLDLLSAVRNLVDWGFATIEEALAMASTVPADLCPAGAGLGRLVAGARADLLHLPADLSHLAGVWQGGQRVL